MAAIESRARRWLRLDALYCAGAGMLAMSLAGPLGRLLHVVPALLVAVGAAAVCWAWLLMRLARRPAVRQPLQLVAAANAAASVGVAVLAAVAPAAAGQLLLAAVAVEVAAFAAVQLRVLRMANGDR